MKLVAISGSVRKGSYNTALLRAMQALCPADTSLTIYDQLGSIPIFDPDVADSAIPEVVTDLMTRLRDADGVIISTPEYAHGVTGILKNALDWLVASDALILKPVLVTSVSTSGLGGVRSHAPLVLILSAMNANVVIEASLNVPYAQLKFDDNLTLTDDLTQQALQLSLQVLRRTIETG